MTEKLPEVSSTMQGDRLLADLAIQDLQAELAKQQQQQHSENNKVKIVGFCAGMIAAVTVASSSNRQEFEKYGGTALRIGALMAALVGATEARSKGLGKGGSISLATAWRTQKQGEDMSRIVSKLFPDAYISVLFDETRATVTASERLAPKLIRQLRAAGVTAIPLAFKGQLHTPTAERERQTEALIELCHSMPELQFPDAAQLTLPTYLDHPEGKQVSGEEVDLVDMVLRSILANRLNWTSTVSKLAANKENISIIAFGLDRPLPPTILRALGSKQVHFEDVDEDVSKSTGRLQDNDTKNGSDAIEPDIAEQVKSIVKPAEDLEDVVAIVGMSLKVAGGQDLEEFEKMLKTGESQHEVITREWMTPDMLFRDQADPSRKWYGNFMLDLDAFDHKFFKKSPHKSIAIDPQGWLSLEVAYQALEQSGYFNELATTNASEHKRWKHIGVYVGLCSYEYDVNIYCHLTSAFTGTGKLRSFIPGRVSHYFGWTGLSLTFDTVWQCKPFDSAADGYCRGDGIAYVFLKKLLTAIADGNTVLGTICSTSINQNLNTTPLFVPNVLSLLTLFNDMIRKARVDPHDISLVKCYGTGIPVGDPAEWESIRNAVAGPARDIVLPIRSNASAVVAHSAHKPTKPSSTKSSPRLPFWISGLDSRSIAAYSAMLAPHLRTHAGLKDKLQERLAMASAATKDTFASIGIAPVKSERPVILCFGGQVAKFVGLDHAVYENAAILQHHLDISDAVITSRGLDSIYPDIFSCEPYQDVVKLQIALFALQYASAKSWIDCGLAGKVMSVVSHSFSEITALFTVARSAKAIDIFATTLARKGSMIEGVRSRRLNVTNAFHSPLVESIVNRLGEIGKGLTFRDAVIPIERATKHNDTAACLDWTFISSHMRQPVFFNHAIQRLAKKHPQAIFLKSGSNSTITIMASRALAQTALSSLGALHFQSISITNTNKGINRLTDITVDLWKQGLRVSF
ncbi:polyketide synthase [Fusarium phyllophilum]|uniref:Polyketide synthase n=1 Tax=Fusarium phyllophilum TaxID=47803 RepID=A0A8H5K7F3_9HYPO|nr:polyketide synthase [Fusarium phyllophilum]